MDLTFDRVLAFVGLIVAIILIVLDKAQKLKQPVLFILLAVAAFMTLPLAFGNSWVKDTPWGMLKFSKVMLMLLIGCRRLFGVMHLDFSAANGAGRDFCTQPYCQGCANREPGHYRHSKSKGRTSWNHRQRDTKSRAWAELKAASIALGKRT